jgi:class 3 adenylate cyclase/tetratricopeptide (TPR) repeat protein
MKCPSCQSNNPQSAKFCVECGNKFESICPKCGISNSSAFKFCYECGADLKILKETISVDYSSPHTYTPKFLADKILTTRSSIEGERKLVTVLFADVANYTSMSEKLDPEEIHQIMDSCFKILMDEIHKYEGTINQFTGDGVMALFGAPVAHEDHAQRACHAALSIQKAIEDYGTEVHKDYGKDFKMRLGLNSGPVVVGSIGDDLRMDYTAVGDTSNLASRIENMAEPGTSLVSGHTHRLARDFFEFKSLGKVELKGKEALQEVFELIKVGGVDTRIAASVAKGLTRFVGRKRSMGVLMDAYNKAQSGLGQVVGVVGDAGVGKSRLLLEFKNQLTPGEFAYFEGQCLHFGNAMTYLPVLDILRSYFKIKEGDQESLIKKYMAEKILQLDEKLHGILPSFHELLSLKVEDETYQKLEPIRKRDKTFEALRNLLVRESLNKPIILVVEDLHWIDKSSEEFLSYLIEWLANTHILLILLYRPEYTHPWGSKSYYTKIGLTQLTSQSSAELIRAILYDCEIEPQLETLILNRAAGTPLYIEELTHSLLENGSIQREKNQCLLAITPQDIQVPDTIQGIIAARMDRLEDNLKRTMQVASVIGRDFAFRILQTITGLRDELKAYLLNLQGLEFIYERSLFPELEYIFKHALTQEVAYNSLLHKRRKEIHGKIGKAIEQIYAERLEEFFEMLAYHFDQGQVWDKAVKYRVRAGLKARHNYSIKAAMDNFNRPKEILEKYEPDVPWRVRYDLFFEMGKTLMDMGQHPYALRELKVAADIAHREEITELMVQAMFSEAYAALLSHEIGEMKTILAEIEPLVADDMESLLGAVTLQGLGSLLSGDDIHLALAKEKEINQLIPRAPNSPFCAEATSVIGVCHRWRGDAKKCSELYEPLLPILKASAAPVYYMDSLFFYGVALGEQGRYQEAIRVLEEGRKFGLKSGERYNTPKLTNSLAWAYHELCHFAKAREYNHLALDSIQELLGPGTSDLFEIEAQTRINLGENYLMTGDVQKARKNLNMVYDNINNPAYYFARTRWKPRCLLGLGELWLQTGDADKAESFLSELFEHQWTDKFPYKKYQVRAWHLKSGILSARGRMKNAEIELTRALTQAKQLGNPTLLWKTHQAVGNQLLKRGKNKDAKAQFQTALKVVQNIAEGLTDVALKEGYLQSDPVQELFSQAQGGQNQVKVGIHG